MDAYIYIRFSTPAQEDGSSYERQLEACEKFVREKGWNKVDVIEDLGKSAWKGDHLTKGNLGKFANRIFANEIPPNTVVVAENLDRFSRQEAYTTLEWVKTVCSHGITIATVANSRVYDRDNLKESLMPIMEVLLLAEGAYNYVKNIRTRVDGSYAARLKEARESNTAITAIGPSWLKAEGKRPNIKWIPIPERTKIVREIYDLAAAGVPPWGIARQFNDRKEPSFNGVKWERTAIVKILRSRAVEGDKVVGTGKNSTPTGEVLTGYYGEWVVQPEIVAQARAMLDRRRQGGRGRNVEAIHNLFGRKVECGRCGSRMMTTGYKSGYVTCYEASRGTGCTHRASYRYRPFEKSALDAILHFALDEKFFRQAQQANHLTAEIADTQKAISDKEGEAEYALGLAIKLKSETAERKLAEIEAEVRRLKGVLAKLESQLDQARGAATAEAHLARVHEVRDALVHEDAAVRIPARLRVSEAVQAVVNHIQCDTVEGVKRFELALIGGAYAVRFDNEGNKIAEVGGHLPTIVAERRDQTTKDMVRRIAGREVEPPEPLSNDERGPYSFFGCEGPQDWTPEREA